jgi:hypothetical protein
MAKFSQNTLNQVAGFDGQIIAQELVYNQDDFWNLSWASVISYPSGWQATTEPVDLTGATISVQIIRRALENFRDSRTGLDFIIHDYPLVKPLGTITQSDATNDYFTIASTADLFVGQAVTFTGTVFGGVSINTVYYVKEIPTATTFSISATRGSGPTYTPGSVLQLTSASGSMVINRASPNTQTLTVSNRDDTNGTFTITIDTGSWEVVAGDPDLDINATEPVCFTGRIKISFPASGTQPAYDEVVFLLFLVASDGVVNNG